MSNMAQNRIFSVSISLLFLDTHFSIIILFLHVDELPVSIVELVLQEG